MTLPVQLSVGAWLYNNSCQVTHSLAPLSTGGDALHIER